MDLLAPGDKVIFDMPNGTFTYSITSITIVQPEDIEHRHRPLRSRR